MIEKQLMDFIGLGLLIGIVVVTAFLLNDRYTRNFEEIVKKSVKQYSNKQIIIGICILMPIGLYIVINFPIQYMVLFELVIGTMLIGLTAYILANNKLALLSGVLYPALYLCWWNTILMNFFAMFIAMGAILILHRYIKPTQMLLICGLIVVYDFVMVYMTQDMITAAHKIVETELPMYVAVQTTPESGIILGLGDIVFTGLLVMKIAEWKDYDKRCGLRFIGAFCALSIMCLVVAIAITPSAVPATIPIMIAAGMTIGLFSVEGNKRYFLLGIVGWLMLALIVDFWV